MFCPSVTLNSASLPVSRKVFNVSFNVVSCGIVPVIACLGLVSGRIFPLLKNKSPSSEALAI